MIGADVGTFLEKPWTVGEIATALQAHPDTVRVWLRHKKLPGVKVGKGWRVADSQLRHLLLTNY